MSDQQASKCGLDSMQYKGTMYRCMTRVCTSTAGKVL